MPTNSFKIDINKIVNTVAAKVRRRAHDAVVRLLHEYVEVIKQDIVYGESKRYNEAWRVARYSATNPEKAGTPYDLQSSGALMRAVSKGAGQVKDFKNGPRVDIGMKGILDSIAPHWKLFEYGRMGQRQHGSRSHGFIPTGYNQGFMASQRRHPGLSPHPGFFPVRMFSGAIGYRRPQLLENLKRLRVAIAKNRPFKSEWT
jgi:hypothetical protein